MKWKALLVKQYTIKKNEHVTIVLDPEIDQLELTAQEGAQVICHYFFKNIQQARTVCATFTALRNASITLYYESKEHHEYDVTLAIKAIVKEQGATINLLALTKAFGSARQTITTEQIHTAPDTFSSFIIKSVVQDAAYYDYRGLIWLQESSSRANAQQENKVLLLSKTAHVTSQPTLQILHDAVQCSHGTAIASSDPEHLFYLLSRGLELKQAQSILIQAFLK
ncbi:MAG: SufD family Fe-S cluster assembly protein [Proteobacteria bacterium]|nr:SufD family Fe-S cluster assembly protein [Pseudomonadota bacterium]NBP15186.1 SufD family Fe-S cluster assembly protein [bacterium]